MKITSSKFVISNTDHTKCPAPDRPEYAFVGRSNVGKSSLINMLTDKKKLAKTSGTPGKTRLINHFLINKSWFLVDLPGYGWARVSKEMKEKWDRMTKNYLGQRENLHNVFVLIDSRIPPQKIDIEFLNWLGRHQIPFSIVFTKADKPNNSKIQLNIAAFLEELRQFWEEIPPTFVTSSAKRIGQKEILGYIGKIGESA